MSFLHPVVLVALVAIPLLVLWYVRQQRLRAQAAEAFANPTLVPSVAPSSPRWRRHVPMLVFALALAVLIVAAARPQRTRGGPDQHAPRSCSPTTPAARWRRPTCRPPAWSPRSGPTTSSSTGSRTRVRVGLVEFNTKAALLQSPTTDRGAGQVRASLSCASTGGTAIGDAIQTALQGSAKRPAPERQAAAERDRAALGRGLRRGLGPAHRRPAGGREAHPDLHGRARHAERHGHGEARQQDRHRARPARPRSSSQQIARIAHGESFTVADAKKLDTVYQRLGAELGHKKVKHEITAELAGGGLVLAAARQRRVAALVRTARMNREHTKENT